MSFGAGKPTVVATLARAWNHRLATVATAYHPPFILLARFLVLGWVVGVSILNAWQLAAACVPQEQTPTPRVFDQREQTFVAGLLQRRLFDVAEAHCLELLDQKEIQVADQTALTVQLIQTRTSMALVADAASAENAWQAVWQTGEDFDKQFARHPGKMQVSIQTGLAYLQRAQRMGSAIEAQMVSRAEIPTATEAMLKQCRDAKRIFTTVEREIERLLPERRSRTIAAGELGPQQLLSLKSSVRYQIALCQLQVAAAYQDSDSVAWGSALNDVLRRLQEVQDSVIPSQQIWWQSKVSQLECLLMLGKTREVERLLSTLPKDGPPANVLPKLIEQQLALAIATGDTAKLTVHLLANSGTSPELALAQIRAAVALSKLLDDSRQQSFWLEDASRRKQQVQLRHGAWWGRRAGLTLIRAAGGTDVASAAVPSGSSAASSGTATRTAAVELLVQTALQAQRDGDLGDALKAYDRAIEQSPAPGDVLRLQIRASQILEQQSQPLEAAKRLTTAASGAPNQRVAAATHLRGIWNLARAGTTANPSNSDKTSLVQTLDGHLTQWPESSTKNTAALWLMAEHIRANDADKALVAFDAVDSLSESFPEALTQIRALYFQARKRAPVNDHSSVKLARDILARLGARNDSLRESGDRGYRASIANAAIEIGLDSKSMSAGRLAAWAGQYSSRFAGEPEVTDQERQLGAWFGLLMILEKKSLNQSDVDNAAMFLQGSNEAMCRRLFRVVSKRESELAATGTVDGQPLSKRRALQLFGLEIIAIVNRLPLSVKDSDRWKFQWGSLLRKTQQPKEAVSLLEPLAQRFRGDLLIQLEFTRALSEAQFDGRQEDTLKAWRRLAKSLTPATENWFEARLNVARQLELAGDREAAKKLLLYTRSVYGWEKSVWSDDLDRLLRLLRTVSTP